VPSNFNKLFQNSKKKSYLPFQDFQRAYKSTTPPNKKL